LLQDPEALQLLLYQVPAYTFRTKQWDESRHSPKRTFGHWNS
jgi:hypothetical protein